MYWLMVRIDRHTDTGTDTSQVPIHQALIHRYIYLFVCSITLPAVSLWLPYHGLTCHTATCIPLAIHKHLRSLCHDASIYVNNLSLHGIT